MVVLQDRDCLSTSGSAHGAAALGRAAWRADLAPHPPIRAGRWDGDAGERHFDAEAAESCIGAESTCVV